MLNRTAFLARQSAGLLSLLLILVFLVTPIPQKPASARQSEVPLNQALVLAGGESTNPRDYDPATTYGSGDKLAFSGLVEELQRNLTAKRQGQSRGLVELLRDWLKPSR